MSKPDIKQLCIQYEKSDSLSERVAVKEKIIDICKPFLKEVDEIYREYNLECPFLDGQYRSSSGHLSYKYLLNDLICLEYEDLWGYGGSCRFRIPIPIKEIEDFDRNQLIDKVKTYKKDVLNKQILNLKRQIESLEKQIEKIST